MEFHVRNTYTNTEKVDCHCRNNFCNVASNSNDNIFFEKMKITFKNFNLHQNMFS